MLTVLRCRLVDDANMADCWVINTCTVKSPSQSAMDNLLEKGRASDKALVVAGCVPQGDRRARQLQGLSVLGESSCKRHSVHPPLLRPQCPAASRTHVAITLCWPVRQV